MALVKKYIENLKECLEELSEDNIETIADIIFDASRKGKHIFICGNGGSAATSLHFARDLQIGTAREGKPRVRATCLADNVAFITAIANDIDYSAIFEEQLRGVLEEGDVVIGISASGNSPNVLRAIDYARLRGAVTIGLIGFGGGRLKELADKSIVLSSNDYRPVEDTHMVLAHLISYLVQNKISQS